MIQICLQNRKIHRQKTNVWLPKEKVANLGKLTVRQHADWGGRKETKEVALLTV